MASRVFWTGDDLYMHCTSDYRRAVNRCINYISGAVDMLVAQNSICLPDNVRAGQITDIVKAFLSQYPETLHYSAASEIILALTPVFRCQRVPQ